jgi:DNA polymerase III epsilon subunit-like protein
MAKHEHFIFFDLETSNSGRRSEILQIGAVDLDDSAKKFSAFVKPKGSINPFASRVNFLTLGMGNHGFFIGMKLAHLYLDIA